MPQQETNVASEGFNVLWVTALVNWVAKEVESRHTSDAYRWPVIRFYDADVYQALPSIRLFIIRDKSSGGLAAINAAKEWPSGVQRPDADVLTSPNLFATVKRLYTDFNVRQQDLLFLLPEDDLNVTDSWNQMSSAQQNALRIQLAYVVRNQFYYVRGFDAMGNFIIPPGYDFLANECKRFLEDHPSYDKNVFLMTRFDSSNRFSVTLDQEVRTVLRSQGFDPVRADDKMYMPDRNLWNNVCVYMLCCSSGIAILEDRVADEFNPNVAIEYGFMRALNKPTLLLADRAFRNLRADIIGTLRETFDLTDIEATIPTAVERWLRDSSGL